MWMKVDDRLHSHRKTRRVITASEAKRRDIAPMGLWVIAGSWSGQNGTEGWVPEHELDRWDDDWSSLASRLVKAGYWWPEQRDGEAGFAFVDWADYNPTQNASNSGRLGNHVRWHVNQKVVDADCEYCPSEPADESSIAPESGGDIGGRSGSDIAPDSQIIALPDPTRPDPTPKTSSPDVEREFNRWYANYPRKSARGQALKAYRSAVKKASPDTLVEAVTQQTPILMAKGTTFCPHPATWLNGERWLDEAPTPTPAEGWWS